MTQKRVTGIRPDELLGIQYLHCLLRAVSSGLSERALHLHRLLGYDSQKLFAAAGLRVILAKLRKKITIR